MNECNFKIGADGVDVNAIVEEIRKTVAAKTEQGLYTDPQITRAEKANLVNLKDDEKFAGSYLETLRDAIFVDISDFEILERRTKFTGLFVALKRLIWKLMKFYTYRLWSQQNEINGLLLSASETIHDRYRDKIAELEKRIEKLEK